MQAEHREGYPRVNTRRRAYPMKGEKIVRKDEPFKRKITTNCEEKNFFPRRGKHGKRSVGAGLLQICTRFSALEGEKALWSDTG